MKKLACFAFMFMLSGCCGGNLFEGPECNKAQPRNVAQPCQTYVVYCYSQPAPVAQPAPVVKKTQHLAAVVYFANGSYRLNGVDKAELNRVAKYAITHNTPVKIMGHASHKVNPKAISKREAINLEISRKRTQKVALALAGMGVDPKMMSANAYSDYRPAEVEVDARSEALNRRVEIYMEY